LTYLVAGAELLPEDRWERRHDLAFALELHRAECEYVTGQLVPAEARLAELATRAATLVERAAVASLRLDLHTLDQSDRAISIGQLSRSQSQPRAWQRRGFLRRLCAPRDDRRRAVRRLPQRVSLRSARVRTNRTARLDALPASHRQHVWRPCHAMDEAGQGR